MVNSPQPRGKGRSRDKAAERLGIGEQKAERGLKVVQVADKLKEAGEEEKAEEQIIREYERNSFGGISQRSGLTITVLYTSQHQHTHLTTQHHLRYPIDQKE